VLHIADAAGRKQQVLHGQLNVWDYLDQQLAALRLAPRAAADAAAALPFNFWGGFVGYLGYGLKAECGGGYAHTARAPACPDAAWQFADRLLVADHATGDVYLLVLHDGSSGGDAGSASAAAWLQGMAARVAALAGSCVEAMAEGASGGSSSGGSSRGCGTPVVAALAAVEAPAGAAAVPGDGSRERAAAAAGSAHTQPQQLPTVPAAGVSPAGLPHGMVLRHTRERYLANIAACKAALAAGESYELCLTTALEAGPGAAPDPWQFYSLLRTTNPAPYAAWLSFGGSPAAAGQVASAAAAPQPASVVVCCSSPERFLQGGRGGLLEAKPIKGTARRHTAASGTGSHGDDDAAAAAAAAAAADAAAAASLLASEKERAENLMIVDLLRNDLGRVCVPGSVHVPGLIQLESYARVHQLVSTVRGLRDPRVSCVAAIRAAFPGGSMTGAPKVRSMALLDGLEGCARGVYSGALGYLSVNDTFDLNIVIRSAVFTPAAAAGGDGADEGGGASSSSGGMCMSVGAGGAIVLQSDPAAEFAEMQLKAEVLLTTAAAAVQQQAQAQQGGAQQQLLAAGAAGPGQKQL
jgi:para-aminobenzoate synthetase